MVRRPLWIHASLLSSARPSVRSSVCPQCKISSSSGRHNRLKRTKSTKNVCFAKLSRSICIFRGVPNFVNGVVWFDLQCTPRSIQEVWQVYFGSWSRMESHSKRTLWPRWGQIKVKFKLRYVYVVVCMWTWQCKIWHEIHTSNMRFQTITICCATLITILVNLMIIFAIQ